MNNYIAQIKEYLESEGSAMDILYNHHLENSVVDDEQISSAFAELDSILSKLTLKEYDRVWDAACRLCDKHERRGFLAGLRSGAGLMLELAKNEQGKDSCF